MNPNDPNYNPDNDPEVEKLKAYAAQMQAGAMTPAVVPGPAPVVTVDPEVEKLKAYAAQMGALGNRPTAVDPSVDRWGPTPPAQVAAPSDTYEDRVQKALQERTQSYVDALIAAKAQGAMTPTDAKQSAASAVESKQPEDASAAEKKKPDAAALPTIDDAKLKAAMDPEVQAYVAALMKQGATRGQP